MTLSKRIVSARALQEQRPLRTFRTEFNIYENSSCEERYTSTTTHYTQSQYSLERHERTERTERREISERSETIVSSSDAVRRSSSQESARLESGSGSIGQDGGTPTREIEVEEKSSRKLEEKEEKEKRRRTMTSSSLVDATTSERSSEIRSLKRSLERAEEGVGRENVIDARGIVDPRTGQLLTVGEAINLRILDVRRGRITCSRDGKSTSVTIEEAAREKMIETRLADRLLGPCGYDEEGRPVSLLGAIQRELFDAEKADGVAGDRAKVTYYRECGGGGGSRPAAADEVSAVSVADAMMREEHDDDRDDRDGDKHDDEDVGRLGEAALDPRTGELVTEGGERLSVEEAHARGYLAKLDVTVTVKRGGAFTLSDAINHGLVDEAGRVLDRITGEYHTLDEAVEKGILDPTVKEIVDPRTGNDKITLREALHLGTIDSRSGKYVTVEREGRKRRRSSMSLKEARKSRLIAEPMTLKDCHDAGMMDERGSSVASPSKRGLKLSLMEAMRVGILDEDRLRSVTDTRTGEMVTLAEAVRRGLIDAGRGTYVDASTNEETSVSEAVERGRIVSLVRRTIFDVDGFKDPSSGEYVSLNAALLKGLIRSESGGGVYAVDPGSGTSISLAEAEERGYVRPEVSEMLNRGIGMAREGREMTLLEAILSESIDPRTGMLLDRSRGRRPIPLEDAIKRGLITPDGAALLTGLLNITVTTQTRRKEIREERGRMDDTDVVDNAVSFDDDVPRAIGTTTTIIAKDRVVSRDARTRTNEPIDSSSGGSFSGWVLERKDPDQDQDTSVANEFAKEEDGAGGGWSTTEKRVFELPTDGWSLSEAIERKLFDPTTGLFIIPGTDRLVSFEECVKLRIIDPNSSLVIDPSNGRKVSLLRSLEKSILDSTGHYTSPRKITMKEAIDQGLIVLDDGNRTETETKYDENTSSQHRLLRITKVVGEPDKLEVTRSDDPSKRFEIKISEAGHSIPDPVRVSRGLIYDPSTALVISTESGRSTELLQALSDGTLPPELVLVKDPATGRDVCITEAVQRGIVDSDTARYNLDKRRKISLLDAAKFGIVSVIGTPLVPIASSTTPTKDHGVPAYRTEAERIAREQALSPVDQEEISVTGKPPASVSISESDSAIGSTSVVDSATDFSPTAASEEPSVSRTEEELEGDLKFQYATNAIVVQRPSPETELETETDIVLQKMRKRVMKTREALETGFIDEETAEILSKESIITADGKPVSSLSDAIRSNRIDARRGRIIDPQRGDVLTIGEAVERGVLDPVSGDVLVPLAKSLSIPGLYQQGLLDPREGKVVHPETGARLTLGEAILCEIVDPLSELTCSDGRVETLRGAIESDLVDPDRSLIKTREGGSVGLVKAVESRSVFADSPKEDPRRQRRIIPPAGMTFAVALERGLIDASGKEIRHPITEERLPLEEAIRGNFIMSLPCPVTSDSMEVTKALEAGLIDREKGVYVHPTTGTPVSLATAIESGLLIVKPATVTRTSKGVTETVTRYHTVTRKTVVISPGYELASGDEVRNVETGDVMGIEEARGMGIVRDEGSARRERFTTKDVRTTLDRAFERGLLDMREGTYTDPSTGRSMPIGRAIESGLLEEGSSRRVERIDRVYDEGTERFLDPETRESYTLSEAMEVGLVDPDTVIYDTGTAGTVTAREAVERGMIDPVTGRTREDRGGGAVSLKQAAKLGLLAVVAAPVLAGKAVYDALARRDGGEKERVGEEEEKAARKGSSRVDEAEESRGKKTPARGQGAMKEAVQEMGVVEEGVEREKETKMDIDGERVESKKEVVSKVDMEKERAGSKIESVTKVERVEPELKVDVDGEKLERKKEPVESKKESELKMDVDREQMERKKEPTSKDDLKQAEPKKESELKMDVDREEVERKKEPMSKDDVKQVEPKKESEIKMDVDREELERKKETVESKKEPELKMDVDREQMERKKEPMSKDDLKRVESKKEPELKINVDREELERKKEPVSKGDAEQVEPDKKLVSEMDVDREEVERKKEPVESKKEPELKMDVDREQVERKKEPVSKDDLKQAEPKKEPVPKVDVDEKQVESKKEPVSKIDAEQAEPKKEPVSKLAGDEKQVEHKKESEMDINKERVETKKESVSKPDIDKESRESVSKIDIDKELIESKKEFVSEMDIDIKKEFVPKVDVDREQVETKKESVSKVDIDKKLTESKKEFISEMDVARETVSTLDIDKELRESKKEFVSEIDIDIKKEFVSKVDVDKELIESKKEFVSEMDVARETVSTIDKELIESKKESISEMNLTRESVPKLNIDKELIDSKKEFVSKLDKELIESKKEFVSEMDVTRKSVSKLDIDKELIESKKEFVSEMDIDSKKEFVDVAREQVETKKESVSKIDIDKDLIEGKKEFVSKMDVTRESISKLELDKEELIESKKEFVLEMDVTRESISKLELDKEELIESKEEFVSEMDLTRESVSKIDIDKQLIESKKESVPKLDTDKELIESKKEFVSEMDLDSKKEFVDIPKERVETKKGSASKLELDKEELIKSKKEFVETVSKLDIDKELIESKKDFISKMDVARETVSKLDIDKELIKNQSEISFDNEQLEKEKSVSKLEETKEQFTSKLDMDEILVDSKKEPKLSKVEEKQDIGEERRGKEPDTEKREESTSEEEDGESEESEERLTIRVTADLTSGDLVARGAYDPDKEKFVDPETGEVVSFHDFVLELGIFDPDHVLVKDLSCKTMDRYVSLREAIAKPLVDRNLGYMVDPKTGKRIPFFEAARSGLIKERPAMPKSAIDGQQASLTLRDAVEIGLLDPSTRQLRDPATDRTFPLNEAIQLGLIDPNSIDVRDPVNDELSSLQEVLESGARIDVEEAFVKGLIVPESRKPISLEAAIRKGLYDEATGRIRDLLTDQLIDVEESVRRGIIDPLITECGDSKAGTFLSLEEALREPRLFDSSTGRLRDTRSGESLALSAALDRGLITTCGFAPTLIDAIVREYYCPRTGLVSNPRTGEETTLREALDTDYVDGGTTVVRDDRSDEVLSLREAGERRLIDLERGILTSPHSMTLNVAYEKGYILSTVKPWSLQQALAHQTYDPDRGLFVIDGVGYTLEDALEKGLIARDSPSVRDPRSSEIISLGEAIEAGLIDPRTGTALDPSTAGQISLTDAVERGLVVPAKRKISLPEAVFKGLYEPATGRFIVPETSEKLQTDRAIKVGAIDPSTAVVVRQPHGRAITFSKAIKELIVDPKTGTVANEKGKPIDFREALERGLLLEARRPMTFSEAISKGILDERTNKFLDPQTGVYLSLVEAVKGNLIDADSVTVKDGRSGFRERICLTEAIRSGYIDGWSGRVRVTADSSMSLREAYEAGLIVDHRAAVSLQRAIHQGLYDPRTGKITDPSTGRAVTLHEAMRNCLVSPVLPCYWDKRAARLLSLAETCRAGVIDRRTGMFREQGTGAAAVTLTEALETGLIVDIESPLCLHQAIAINVYEPATGSFRHPTTNRKLTLAEACDAELIDPYSSIVRDARRDVYVPLSLALSSELVDGTRGTYLALPSDEPPIDLREAARRGYVVPSNFPLAVEAAVNCDLYRGEETGGVFIDPRRNESHDLAAAFDKGLLDPATTALKDGITGQLVAVERGMENGTIDAARCRVLDTRTERFYPIDVAFERGLLLTLDRPLASRGHPPPPSRGYSAVGCGTRGEGEEQEEEEEEEEEEEVSWSLVTAIEKGLVDARTAVVRDPGSGRFVAIGDALEERRILDPSWTGRFGGQARLVRVGEADVYLAQPLGLEEAIERGLLDGEGRVVDSRTRERVTLGEAVRLGIVDPESAVVKDTRRRRLVRLAEAFKRGLMDAEKGNVLETETSRLYPLPRAIEADLLITPSRGFSLIDALQFGLYHADTGKFRDPFRPAAPLSTLKQAIDSASIDPTSTVIKVPGAGKIVSLLEAVNAGIVDPIAGKLIEDPSGKRLDFANALEQGYILTAEARQAVEEKYKLCDETSSKLLKWISEVEEQLANQENAKEDIEELRNQITAMNKIKVDLEAHSRPVSSCLDQIRQVVLTGGNVLSSEEVSTLEKNGRSLKTRFDKASDRTERMVKRLNAARDELVKFKNELSTFSHWLEGARRILEKKEHSLSDLNRLHASTDSTRDFISDVIAHQADLRFITMAAQKFVDEGKEFLHALNEFRANLPQPLPAREAIPSEESAVRGEVGLVSSRYKDLLARANLLSDKLSGVGGRQRDYREWLEKARGWLREMEPRVNRAVSEATAAEPKQVEEQLGRIKALNKEMVGNERLVGNVRSSLEALLGSLELVNEGSQVDASHLRDEAEEVGERASELKSRLDARYEELESAASAVGQFYERAKSVGQQVALVERELDSMRASSREVKALRAQMEEAGRAMAKVGRLYEEVSSLERLGERLADYGVAAGCASVGEQVEQLKRQVGRLDERSRDRHHELSSTLDKLQEFHRAHGCAMEGIEEASERVRRLKPVGSEVESIKAQQEDFRVLKGEMIEPLARSVDECNGAGQALIQTAGRDVSTANIERDLDRMNERWNDLKEKLNERDRRLDVGLLQSGKFQEALDGLQKWLADTEEMVSNQKPPSSDYKVIKAQLQGQKFLRKMLMDRQNSMSSLYNMGQEVAGGADPKERKTIEKQLKELVGRFDDLTESAAERMEALEQAMGVAKQFQDKLVPLSIWLDKTEKRVRDMELVPTDEEKIQQRVTEHDGLHEDILSRKPDFSELTEIASQLMALVGEDEAAALADKLQDAADRYAALVERSEALGGLLQRSRQGLRHLVLSYQELQAWMEGMEMRLSKYRVLAVHTEKLLQQMEDLADLTEEVSSRQTEVDGTTDAGLELMKHISSDEALQLKDKLDSLQRRFNDLVSRGSDLLKHAQESLPLVQQFHDNHNRLMDWMQAAESALQSAEPREDEIVRLEMEISEYRPVLDKINAVGPQLSQLSPGEGAATIEALVTRDNRRFDAIAEQIQRKAERIQLSKQRSLEVIGDIDDLLEWFREVDNQLREAEPPSSEPEIIRVQLKEHKALNDDISSQKGRVRDVISTAKKVIRENSRHEDTSTIRENMEDLRETMEIVSGLSADRLGALEQALPLAEHLRDTHVGLVSWLEEAEQQVAMLPMPALRPDLIVAQQDKNELLVQSINEHKPLVEKLNKTGEALIKLCNEEEGMKIQDILEADTARYAALRAELRSRQQTLEQALQESSQFSDKLEGMLRALSSTADQVNGAEPISAHPGRLRDQMEENSALIDELAQRSEAYAAVKRAADDVISKAGNRADPAVKDIKRKLEKLNKLWADVQKSTTDRSHTLDDALQIAEKFWSELNGVMSTLRELQDALAGQAPPAAQPAAIQQQQVALQEIRHEIDQTKPDVEQVRASGHELMGLCGEPDKPEVRKHIEDLDQAWDNVTALYARREENLIDAMEKAMEFHETLQNLLEFLEEAEEKFARMGPLGSDIDEVKKQIKQLANFKAEVDPHMVKVEALNRSLTRQAAELTERTSSEQAAAIKEPLGAVNKRWDGLLRGLVERQRLLENALLRLGQFQHALDELLVWIEKTDDTLDNLKAVAGDPQVIEVELAKLKVLVNDIQAHQTSVDTLNDAGRQLIEDGKGTAEASTTAEKLGTLNRRWRDLLQRAADRQRELEDALREAQSFTAEIQDLLSWLGDVDNTIVASKPVGGLPETATEQLERFMEVYNELEQSRGKVETVLQQGQEYLKRADSSSAGGLSHNLKTLKQRWDNVTARANDKRIKLEIALKEATEFHDALQAFVDWLTNAEKILTNLKPVSRVMETILGQIEEHKAFQKDVGVHRETMLNLDKKGTHLKYFSQKQDVILIKNLLISVQHRWERVVSKSAERTRALDHGYKEAREFHDAWSALMNWLDETERILDEVAGDGAGLGGNDPEKIKARLNKHRELQKALSSKQGAYDLAMKNGKSLKDKAPKSDELALKELLNELKNKWTTVCGKCVDRQRRLEEALLFSGQFKDAVQALLEWLVKSEKQLANTGPLFGDLDTVTNLVEQHKTFEKDLESRATQMESVIRTGRELLDKATQDDAAAIGSQLAELNDLWDTVTRLSTEKTGRLEAALREAERLHKAVHVLLEWLSDAEMKLRFAGQLPEDEQESRNQLMEHEKFLRELRAKEVEKEQTLELAQAILAKAHPDGALVIKHWITIIQSRWEEVSTWAQQRNQRLENHMRGLQDLDNLLEELLSWLEGLENTLNALEAEPLPDDKATLEMLIGEHREFMESTSRRQDEVDRVCKARQIKSAKDAKKITKAKSPAPTRASPGRERTPDSLPHIGPRFPPKGSKGAEPEFRSPRVKLLWDRWRHVWMLAWERQRRLQDKYNYIQELDRVANFSWEDWRKRFLKFMNHKKSRLTDLFRKMDKNNDGLIPREDFIQGIMNTKFETSRLEMGAVADLFDQHGEGLIDWKEFIAALRPDWEERRTYNDTDKIHDEVKRLVMLCTCRQKFRVFQVGEGKYRFGDSQKLRLVRILRSTVMVRVGGGWVALDEFLLKNDPCRAKGRTNIELREQFILADGVSQTMTAFRSKPSPTSTLQRTHISSASAGPITKVRERSARSVPMGQSRASRSSLSAGTPDSLSDNESSFKIASARKSSTPYRSTITPGGSRPSSRPASRPASRPTSRPGSRPASRQGSKPPSRYGSTQSLDSTDESTNVSRIPRRTAVSTTGNTPTSSRHNSVSGKRLGTPVNGSSSRPRTPTGLVSPASGVPSRFGTIHRASSIPTLTGVGTPISRSRIPVYVGTDIKSPQSTTSNISTHSTQSNHSTVSTDSTGSSSMCTNSATNTSSAVKQARTRTPSSGSSTPLPPSLKLSRKPSGASDTSVSTTTTTTTTTPASHRKGKPTPVDQRAPFRL
ncbi:microtubule-actin cross-linking factor 1, isoforms 1/2/3/5-like isoform X15 [Apis laboriosa]|uniref:microtubule-actin cross-linking factor 1, isoforms 1/2/3/5-like isoform X15 n=1 Tax=Apis laboriosa TaxID=183418 RepID=UPI001CC7A98B|nr:microtubule-actin cross-linking factor 1, isoforms 1/2/3/5-like isoform X15 [Apis laboriosa]